MNRSCLLGAGIVLLVSARAGAAPGSRLADLESPVPSVRAAAALACARADDADAVSAVEAAFLRETDERARRAEARCLVHLEAPSSLPALFRHPQLFDSRLAILDPLAEAPGAEPFLLSGLDDPQAAVRAFCLRHLAFPQDPGRVERAVLDAIGRETDAGTLREALTTAGWVGGRPTLDFLRGAFRDPRTGAVAARSLAQIAGRLDDGSAPDGAASGGIPQALLGSIAERLSDAIGTGTLPGRAGDTVKAEILCLAARDRRLAPLLAPAAGALLLRAVPNAASGAVPNALLLRAVPDAASSAVPDALPLRAVPDAASSAVPRRGAPWAAPGAAPASDGSSEGLLAAAAWLLRTAGFKGQEARIRAGALFLDPGSMADGAGMLLDVDGASASALLVSRLEDPRCFRAALDGLIRLGEAARAAFNAAAGTRSAARSTAYAIWQVGMATRAIISSGTALDAAFGTAPDAASGTAP